MEQVGFGRHLFLGNREKRKITEKLNYKEDKSDKGDTSERRLQDTGTVMLKYSLKSQH